MTRKHFIEFNNLFINMFNRFSTKKELKVISSLLWGFVRICAKHNYKFRLELFTRRLEKNLEPKTKTLLKRFKLEF